MDANARLNTIITRLDGKTYNLNELGVVTRDFIVSSPNYTHTTTTVPGRPGAIHNGTQIGPRTIRGVYYMRAFDNGDYALMRDEVFALFNSDEPFYVQEVRAGAKRWLVRVDGGFEMDQQGGKYGFFDVNYIAFNPFAESLAKTGDVKEWDVDLWAWGMGIDWDDSLAYTFNTSTFTVRNLGNVPIKATNTKTPLKITLKGTFTNGMIITNITTGDVYQYNGTLTQNDTLVLDGVRSLKNGLSVFGDTNKRLLTIAPGNNEFTITGGTVSEITFDFRFYYL